jgi:hypothetical protein
MLARIPVVVRDYEQAVNLYTRAVRFEPSPLACK